MFPLGFPMITPHSASNSPTLRPIYSCSPTIFPLSPPPPFIPPFRSLTFLKLPASLIFLFATPFVPFAHILVPLHTTHPSSSVAPPRLLLPVPSTISRSLSSSFFTLWAVSILFVNPGVSCTCEGSNEEIQKTEKE